jgi:hypothetical protein
MSLFFLQPIYLYGLVAAALPIAIHLLNRRRQKRLLFPAVRFLLLSERRVSRSQRLRHWLLLALRTLAVVLLALLLASPIFQTGIGPLAGGGNLSLALILDNSLSMRWSANENGFKLAQDAGKRIIAQLRDGDEVGIIPTNPKRTASVRLRSEKNPALSDIDATELAAGTADLPGALAKAYDLLRPAPGQKEIWLVTDLAQTGWERVALATIGGYDPSIPLRIVRIPAPATSALNATIQTLDVSDENIVAGVPIRLAGSIVNFGEREIKDLLIQFYLDGSASERRLVSVPARGETGFGFDFVLRQPGPHHGHVALKKEGLLGNPTTYFAVTAADKIRVLVVDGDPRTSLIQSETFFISRALNPYVEGDKSRFLPTTTTVEALPSISFAGYQAIVFCNVAALPDETTRRLRDFLRQGGGVVMFLGDRVDADFYNRAFFHGSPPILPVSLGGKRIVAVAQGRGIESIAGDHPALKELAETSLRESLRSARVWGYFAAADFLGSPLLALASGEPLLTEGKFGPGRILLAMTGADRDWSDLPLKSAYLPLVQSLVRHAAGSPQGTFDSGIVVGGSKQISMHASEVGKAITVRKPDQAEVLLTLRPKNGQSGASFDENDLPGLYRVTGFPHALASRTVSIYAVNSPFLESRLDPISAAEIRRRLEPIPTEIVPLEALKNGGKQWDLSFPLLALLIATLAAEGWLAQRF